VSASELVDLLVPFYKKHYTEEELKQMIEFYKSPLGQKIVEKLALISQDSYIIGVEWGKN
jgi:uncharacterized protein